MALAGACVVVGTAGPVDPASASNRPRITVIGDSVQASFEFAPAAVRFLGEGFDLRVDARVCRRLVAPSCSYRGSTPETALSVVRRLGPALGEVVVVNVGYNDYLSVYDIESMRDAFRRAGVRAVVWVTLRERRSEFSHINALIRAAGRRSPGFRLADWNARSVGRSWFAGDGLHLSATGALELARLLRAEILAALAEAGLPAPGLVRTVPSRAIRLADPIVGVVGEGSGVWVRGRGRIKRIGERATRPAGVVSLGAGDQIVSDGRGARLWRAADGTLDRPALRGSSGPTAQGPLGGPPLLAVAANRLWSAGGGARLAWRRLDGRESRLAPGAPRSVAGLASNPAALWVLTAARGRPLLQVRDPATGALRRSVSLPADVRQGPFLTARAAWLITMRGRLLRARPSGTLTTIREDVRAAVADGRDRLWVQGVDRRTLLRLDPVTGRPVARAVSPVTLARGPDRLALSRDALWVLPRRGRILVRVREPGRNPGR